MREISRDQSIKTERKWDQQSKTSAGRQLQMSETKAQKSWKLDAVIMIIQRPTLSFFVISVWQIHVGTQTRDYHILWPKMTVSDRPGCRSGNDHFTQLEHRQLCLWRPLNLSLLFIRSSSSTGAHQSTTWHTGTGRGGHTHIHTQWSHKASVGATALWFLLSKGCKMEMRLNGWHGLSLSAACIIESCSNTFDSDCDKLILARFLPFYWFY